MQHTRLVRFLLLIMVALLPAACAPGLVAPAPMAAPATAAPAAPQAPSPVATDTAAPAEATPSQATPAASSSGGDTAQPAGDATAPGTHTVTDDLGRVVAVPGQVARVVSMAPSATEILFAIGAGDQVVGVTQFCNYPPEAQKGREIVGGYTAKTLSVEKVLAARPDVVFSSGSLQKPVIEALEAAHVPVVALEPQDLAGINAAIRIAGVVTGHTAEAEKLAQELERRTADVASVTAQIPEKDRLKVFYEVWDEPLMTAGGGSFIGQIVETAGGVNIFADTKEQYPQVSAETVVTRNPDAIVGPDNHADGLTVEKVKGRSGWQGVKAVQDSRIYIVNGDMISRGGPRAVDALEDLARTLYPERFK